MRRAKLGEVVTVLFTDIVGSTEVASELGDAGWAVLVARHHAAVRAELKRFQGREMDTAGDGFFAAFSRPAEAIRCACAIADKVHELGIEIRAGIHVGEVEHVDGKVGGIAVNVGARIMSLGHVGDVVVSSTVRDLVAGSAFGMADGGIHALKGLEGEWRVYQVTAVDGVDRVVRSIDPDEAAARRRAVVAAPRGRRRIAVLVGSGAAVVVIGLLVVLVARDRTGSAVGPRPLTDADRSVLELVPPDLAQSCAPLEPLPPGVVAGVRCSMPDAFEQQDPPVTSVDYVRYLDAAGMDQRFDALVGTPPPETIDCNTDQHAISMYTVNGNPIGQAGCWVNEDGSWIAWTDDESRLLATAHRPDGADLTLFEFWRTQAGPLRSGALPPKDGTVELLEGTFAGEITEADTELSRDFPADPRDVGPWEFTFGDGAFTQIFPDGSCCGPGQLLFAKPDTVLLRTPAEDLTEGTGEQCDQYHSVRWKLRGDTVIFTDPGLNECAGDVIRLALKPWRRVSGSS